MRKIIKYLASLRFTIVIISLLGLVFMFGLWIPQKSLVKQLYLQWQAHSPRLVAFLDALQLTDIYTAPITVALWVLFFVNLALVMWQRLPLLKNRIALSPSKIADPSSAGGYPFRESYRLGAGRDGAAVIGYLRKRGYVVLGDPERFYGVRNRLAPIAFALFHLSFFLILLGGMASRYTQFIGYLELAEGETFQGELERYVQKPRPRLPKVGSPPQVSFTVNKVEPLASGFTETGLHVELADAAGKVHQVDINRPYTADATSFVLKNLGMAPLFVLKDASGKEVEGAYVKLNVLNGNKDRFTMAGFDFPVTFYPDYVLYEGKPATRSIELNNPVFAVGVERGGQRIASGNISRNGALEFSGYRLELREIPYWVRFSVVKERGIPLLYTGFAIASLAVVWRFLFYRRELVGAVRREGDELVLVVAARSEFYKSLAAEEFDRLFHPLTDAGKGAES